MKTYSSQPLARISNFLPNLHELIALNMLDIRLLKRKSCSGNWDADVKIRIMVYAVANVVSCLRSGNSHQQGSAGLRVSLMQKWVNELVWGKVYLVLHESP